MFYIALVTLGSFYFFSLVLIIFPIKVSKNTLLYVWGCHILALAIMGYYIIPEPELDLYRLFQEIDGIRLGKNNVVNNSPFLILNIIYWFVSKTANNAWYPFFSILFIGGLEFCIIKNFVSNTNQYTTKITALYFLGCNANGFLVYPFSGRAFLVAALFVYAYYMWNTSNKKMFWILALICCLIHILGFVLVLFTILYEFIKLTKINNISFICILFIAILLNTDLPLLFLELVELDYFNLLHLKYQAYLIRGLEFQQPIEMFFRTINLIYALICLWYLRKVGNKAYAIWEFFILITLCSFNFGIIYERMPFVIGIAMLPVLNAFFLKLKRPVNSIMFYAWACIWSAQIMWGIRETWAWLTFAV